MRDAGFKGKLVEASTTSPDVAQCPDCGGDVRKRKRTDGGKTT